MHPILQDPLPQYLERYTSAKAVQADLRFLTHPLDAASDSFFPWLVLSLHPYVDYFRRARNALACRCVFSIDGFNAHIDYDGTCKNWYNPITVDYARRLDYDTWQLSVAIVDGPDLWSPLGVAWHEWNSHIRVPRDVWSIISTGNMYCTHCFYVRSFQAHLDHNPCKHENCITYF
ncbi:hypothetical protein F5146DRAFT_1144202 [Armillaria mellea]|nr:hypothetical protein F5146DRAFT_1144202 [Armillaria mellea]